MTQVRWSWGLHDRTPERENDRDRRFKPSIVEADWLKDDEQEDDWTNSTEYDSVGKS